MVLETVRRMHISMGAFSREGHRMAGIGWVVAAGYLDDWEGGAALARMGMGVGIAPVDHGLFPVRIWESSSWRDWKQADSVQVCAGSSPRSVALVVYFLNLSKEVLSLMMRGNLALKHLCW